VSIPSNGFGFIAAGDRSPKTRSTFYHLRFMCLAMIAAQPARSQINHSLPMGRRTAMRSLALSMTVLAGLAGAPAFAQTVSTLTPQGVPANPATGARPGNEIGTGSSLPMGTKASNIDASDTHSSIAPNLPSPRVGENANVVDYLRAAQSALQSGRTGEAQQSLEMAQTRLLDRSVPQSQTNNPSDNPAVTQISQALKALAAGNRTQTMDLIQSAIPAATAMAQ
jgi:hypothetical protein